MEDLAGGGAKKHRKKKSGVSADKKDATKKVYLYTYISIKIYMYA